MSRIAAALLLWLVAAALATAVALRSAGGPRAELALVGGGEPRTLDPALMTGQIEGRVAAAVFEGLMRRDGATLAPVPGVAESVEVDPAGTVYTFHLRADARWSDGTAVSAEDFVWSWRRLLSPDLGSEYAYILHGVRGARAFHSFRGHARRLREQLVPDLERLLRDHPEGVPAPRWQRFLAERRAAGPTGDVADPALRELLLRSRGRVSPPELRRAAVGLRREADRLESAFLEAEARLGVDLGFFAEGPRTFVVELEAPTPYFLELAAFFPTYPVPRRVVEATPAGEGWFLPERIVGNGPFRLVRWRVGDRIRLERSETYWGREEVALRTVDILSVDSATTALNLYLGGDVDWLPGIYPPDLVPVLRERPDYYAGPALAVYFLRANLRRPPLDDPRVRRALALAVDRREITEEVLGRGELPARHMVPPGLPGYPQRPSPLAFDPAEARRLLADAGYPGGRGLRELGLLYNTSESHRKIAEVVADQLRRHLGVRIRAYNQEWQSYLASVRAGDYDLARAGWIGDYLDANTFLDLFVTGAGNNQTGFSDPRYDALLRAAGDLRLALREPEGLPGATDPRHPLGRALAALRGAGTAEERLHRAAALRQEILAEAESLLVGEAIPVIPLYFYVVSGLVAPRVGGFVTEVRRPDGSVMPNLQDLHPLRDLFVRAPVEGGGPRP